VRSSYTYSKTLDNVSEIFSTFGGGNSLFAAQNPANQITGPGEYSFSGLDYPHQWTILATETLPFYKDQKGLVGHIMGGWALSANYIIASGQRYSPVQIFEATAAASRDYFDNGYIANFASVETAHAFLGNLSAPATSVGIYAGDACNLFDGGAAPTCGLPATTLLSQTAMGSNCLVANVACAIVPVTKDQVRFITNSQTAQTVFGTPFGNMPRNPVSDAISNIANVSIFKTVKLGEHANFQFHATFLNAFNHNNYTSIDPFLVDAGQHGSFTGFGDPTQTPSITRRIIFGGKITF